jgi:hypothetical protein
MNTNRSPNSKNTKKPAQKRASSLLALAGTGKGLWAKNAIELLRIEWNC